MRYAKNYLNILPVQPNRLLLRRLQFIISTHLEQDS